jgi:ABC-type phosphonate transport system ATPase subunit
MSGVAKRFGAVQALSDVSLAVYPGEIVALVGDNAGLAGGQRPEWRRAAGGVAGRNQRAAGWRTRTRSGASTSCSRAPSSSKES